MKEIEDGTREGEIKGSCGGGGGGSGDGGGGEGGKGGGGRRRAFPAEYCVVQRSLTTNLLIDSSARCLRLQASLETHMMSKTWHRNIFPQTRCKSIWRGNFRLSRWQEDYRKGFSINFLHKNSVLRC